MFIGYNSWYFFLDRYIHCLNITPTNHIWMFTGNCRIYFNLYHFTFLFDVGLAHPVRCVFVRQADCWSVSETV